MPNRLFRSSRRPAAASVPLGPFTQGVNEKSEPHLLEFSELADGANAVIDETTGRLKKRPGTLFRTSIPFLLSAPTRAYDFIRRDGTEILIITDDEKLVATQDLVNFSDITPIAFLTAAKFVGGAFTLEFETAEDKVWISNGVDPVFSWDGTVDAPSTSSLVAHDRTSGEITLTVGDTSIQIADALLNRAADGTTWVGQLLVVTDAADPTIIGKTARVLTFVDATDTITFDPIVGLAVGDKVIVGVAIPRGRILRYHFGTMFMGATADNLSELRFTDTVDPNEPQLTLSLDSPHAWPAELQIEIGLGDRLWGFSPVYRNRFAVFKASGLIRIDPDPTFRFVPTVISSQIGSRFPSTWRQHNNILMFLGQDADGLPDVYMTDFTDVSHFNRKHSRTLDNLKQPSSIFRAFSIVAKSEFDAGTESALVDTDAGALQCKKIDSLAELQALIDSGANIDTETSPGRIGLLGTPVGGVRYEADVLPALATPAWSVFIGSLIFQNASGGILSLSNVGGSGNFEYRATLPNPFDAAQDCLVVMRFRPGVLGGTSFEVSNGVKSSVAIFSTFAATSFFNGAALPTFNAGQFYTAHILLKTNGASKLWIDGVLASSAAPASTSNNRIFLNAQLAPAGASFEIDYIYHSPTFKGDSLDPLGGKVTPVAMPDVLPTSGDMTLQIDYKKALENNPALYRYGKFHFDIEDRSQALVIDTSARNRAGVSLAGFAPLTTGQEPGVNNATPKGQKLLVRFSLATTDLGNAQEIKSFTGGFLYLSVPISIGSEIKRWESFQRTLLQAFPTSAIKIRRATSASLAADAVAVPDPIDETGWLRDIVGAFGNITDAEGFVAIADGGNIGTAFGGAEGLPNPPFPDARHLQILISAHVDALADAATKGVDSLLVNWIEGAPTILPTMAVILKKKWILIAATLSSDFNNIAVTVDGNRSFMNWADIDSNFLVWFRGKLYAGNALRTELLQLEDGLLRDDAGSDGAGGRLVRAIEAFIVTKQEVGGEIHERKKAQAIDVMADNDVTTAITVKTERDEESAFTQIGPILTFSPTKTHERIRCPAGLQFKRISVRAENMNLDEDFPLEGFVFSFERVPGRSGT